MNGEFGPFPSPIDRLIVRPNEISVQNLVYSSPQYTLHKAYNKSNGDNLLLFQPIKHTSLSKPNNYRNFIIKCTKLTCPFLLPIIAYTDEEPMMILTDLLKQGSLKDNLRMRNNLSGSQKTIIAISIANAMLYCHHRNVFMPSLTPEIIYITPRGNAKVSVIEMNLKPLLPWSAPEMRSNSDASSKSDVFLFGFILYELFTGETPFGDMPEEQIRQSIQEKKRPSVSRLQPQNLTHLIQQCWSHQPENRPTIEEIVRKLESGDVMFPNTDLNEVDYFISKLENRRRKKNLLKQSPVKNRPNSYLQVFIDYNNPTFYSDLVRIEDFLEPEDQYQFYYIVSNHFKPGTPKKACESVLEAIRVVLENSLDFTPFIRSNIMKLLPYDDDSFDSKIFDILNLVFTNTPESINSDFKRTLDMLIKKSPSKSIVLIGHYCKRIDAVHDPWNILELLFDNVKYFYHSKCGSEYVSTLFFLCFSNQEFYKKNFDRCRNIFCSFLHSEDSNAAKNAYKAVFNLLDPKFTLPFPQIISDVGDTDLSELALSVLMKLTNFPVSKQLIDTLMMLCGARPDAYLLLLLRCADTMEGSNILCNDTQWLSSGVMTDSELLKLVLVLLKNPNARKMLTSSEQLPNFLVSILKNDETEVLICLTKTIQCLNLTRDFLQRLSSVNFYRKLLGVINLCKDDVLKSFLIDIISISSKEAFISDYNIFIDPLSNLLQGSDRVVRSSFTALVYMSFHQECADEMKESNVKDALKKLPQNLIPSDQIQTLLSNIE